MIERISALEGYMSPDAWEHGGLSASVAANGTIYFSGIAAIGADLAPVSPGDLGAQVAFCLAALERGLADHGADWSNLVAITIYTTDPEGMNEHYAKFAERTAGHAPCLTTVTVPSLAVPGLMVEISPVAAT